MRKIIAGLMFSSVCFGGAKVTVKPQWHVEKKALGGTVGMSVYQGLVQGIAFNAWVGAGYRPGFTRADGVFWTGVQAGVDMHQEHGFTITPEFQLRYSPTYSERDNSLNLKLTKQLW